VRSRIRKTVIGLVRLAIGLGIVAFLLRGIHTGTVAVAFRTAPVTVAQGAVYAFGPAEEFRFVISAPVAGGSEVRARVASKPREPLPDAGTLRRVSGEGPDTLDWESRALRPCGLPVLGESFAAAWRRWPLLAAAALCMFACLMGSVWRWMLVLRAQGLYLKWRQAWSIVFVGHFFNSFMFGATGGDVVKAYYAARETGHLKTEAVSTVFIDRVVGLLGLVVLASATMVTRLDFFLADTRTRYALAFMGVVCGGAAAGLAFIFAARPLLRLLPVPPRLAATRLGQVFKRVYLSFHVVLTHPALLAKTVALSMANHFLLVVMVWCVGRALLVERPFIDFLSLMPTISAIGAIPVTPGGLGIRESATIVFLGVVGVSATQALPLSLLSYGIMLFWSVFGGLVFLLYTGGKGEQIKSELARASA